VLELEMTLLAWRNHFTCDVFAERGSAHIESLCKWGPSTFVHRRRKLPSGRPDEESVTLVQPDPTWAVEYAHFQRACRVGEGNLANDLWINERLNALTAAALSGGRA
jgi:scyllo-inositol 2-dehydrogenase (NADP+)